MLYIMTMPKTVHMTHIVSRNISARLKKSLIVLFEMFILAAALQNALSHKYS